MMGAMTSLAGPAYSTLLFDLDHTLLDSDESEAVAFERALRLAGVDDPNQHLATYDAINKALWAGVERREVTPDVVRVRRFEQLVAAVRLDVDPVALAVDFAEGLGLYGELYPGTLAVLDELAGLGRLALVTNGLSDVQRTRIERLDLTKYFDVVVISAEVGCAKPSIEIFDRAFERLGSPSKKSALMVGDSLSSDIQGGTNYGIATCWYNSKQLRPGPADRFDHEIEMLATLPSIVRGAY